MSKADTAREYYSSLRSEINIRIQLRDQALFLYIGATGVLLGIAYSATPNIELLLVVPFIALGYVFIVSQHDSAIVTIASYCNHELDLSLKEEDERVVPWDKSKSMRQFERRVITGRFLAHQLIIILPVLVSLYTNSNHAFQSSFPHEVAWWVGLVLALISIYIIFDAAIYRSSLYEKYPEE